MDRKLSFLRRNYFSSKYLIFAYLALTLSLLVIITQQIFIARQERLTDIKKNLEAFSSISEEAMLSTIENISTVLFLIDQKIEENPKLIKSFPLADLISHKTPLKTFETLELRIADQNGEVVASTSPIKGNIRDRSFFNSHKERKDLDLLISEPFTGKFRPGWFVSFSRRIEDKNGKFLGVVWASLNSEYFGQFLKKFNLGDRSLYLVTSGAENRFLFRYPAVPDIIGTIIKPQPQTDPVFKNGEHHGIYEVNSTLDKVHRYISVTRIGNYPFIVIIGKDIDPVLTYFDLRAGKLLAITLFIIIIGFLLLLGFIKNFKTVTQYESQLASTSKMVALGEMAGAIAHEINNPLAVISTHIQSIERKLKETDAYKKYPDLENSIEKILKTVDRISSTISGLRIFSRKPAEQLNPVNLKQILTEVVDISRDRFQSNGIDFQVAIPEESFQINGDETQIIQVLINLLNNSHDAIQNLKQKWIRINYKVDNDFIEISVSDSGPGIPPEIKVRMMEPFFTTKEVGKGTGLGLSISKGIIESHGGQFYYDEFSQNTRFVFTLKIFKRS